MQEPVTPAATRSGGSGSAMKGEDFTTFIKALTEKYGLFEGKSRIKPPPLALFGTPQQQEVQEPKVDQPLSRVQDILSNADGAGVIRPANEEPGNAANSLNSGLLLKNHSPRTPTRVAGLGRNPNFDAPQSLQSPSPGLQLHRMFSGGDPAATASLRLAGPPQSQASDAPPPLSFLQSPAVPSSDIEVRPSLLTEHRDPLERGRHPPHNPFVGEVDPLIGARLPVDNASLPSSPSSPSLAAGSTRTPFPAESLPLPDPTSLQDSSQPALPEERTLRRPPRRLSLLPSIESELELLEAVVSNRPEAEGEGGSLFQSADDTGRLRDSTGASTLGPDGSTLEQVQGAQVEELGGANAIAIGRLRTTELTSGRQGQQYREGGSLDDWPGVEGLGSGSWLALNRSLRDNGFSALRSPQEGGFLEDVHAVFKDILKQYERRGAMIQDLLAASETAKQGESQQQSDLQRVLQERAVLESKVEILENRAQEAAEGVDQAEANLAERIRKLESVNASLQQRCTQLQHLVRAKERATQKLQDKLEEGVLKEEKRRSRDKEMYEKLKRKLAADARGRGIEDLGKAAAVAARELQPIVLVGLYEAQREATEAELTMLRKELTAAHAELREKDNLIMRKDWAGGWRTLDVGLLLEKQMATEKTANEKALQLAALEASVAEKQQDANWRVAEAAKRADQLAGENANLHLELEARPSVREFRENQRLLTRLTRKIEDLRKQQGGWSESESEEDALEEAEREGAVGRKAERLRPTRERIQRDRNVHRLRLKQLDKLPKDVLLEALQDVCIQLEVSELSLLTSAVDKMLRVLAAVPRMERFISDVCSVVFLEGPAVTSGAQDARRTPDAVPGVLRAWIDTLGRIRELEEFQAVIASELARRPEGRQPVQGPHTSRISAAAVRELVDLERDFLMKEATFRQAEGLVLADPERLIHKMLAHFQRLFEVPRLDGVFARINTVYMQYSEYHNFLRALRSLLGLPDNAGTSACIARIRGLLDQDGQARALVPEYVLGDKRDWGAGSTDNNGQTPAEPTSDKDGHREVVNELKRLFNVNDSKQLLAHCETMSSRLQRHTQVLPRYQSIINSLYDILKVATLDAIVPAVQALVE